MVIGRCAPDFFQVNGKKGIIEVFGCYYHNCPQCKLGPGPRTPEHDAKRLKMFEDLGLKTLVVWEHELGDQNALINRIKERFY